MIDDWPLIEGTLYHGQKITDLINMRAGDNNYAGVDGNKQNLQKSRVSHYDVSVKNMMLHNFRYEENSVSKF